MGQLENLHCTAKEVAAYRFLKYSLSWKIVDSYYTYRYTCDIIYFL